MGVFAIFVQKLETILDERRWLGGGNTVVSILKLVTPIVTGIILLCFASGCTTGTLITGASSAPSGVSHASGPGSKVISYQVVRFEDAVKGTLRAAEALSLEKTRKDIKDNRAELQYADEKNQTVDIVIERRSATITTIQVNAGSFGPRGLTRLVLLQIIEELDQAGAQLEDWKD
jgi:hypothetical protein